MIASRLALAVVATAGVLLVAASSCSSDRNTPDPLTPTSTPTTPQPSTATPAPTSTTARVPANHRAAGSACSTDKVAGDAEPELVERPDAECKRDADCTGGKNGRCAHFYGGGRRPPYAACIYDACVVDSDCGPKSACDCGTSPSDGHQCMGGNCAVDSDCGANSFCSPSMGSCGNYRGVVGNFCHTPTDECVDDADCAGGYCAWKEEVGHWQCSTSQCMG